MHAGAHNDTNPDAVDVTKFDTVDVTKLACVCVPIFIFICAGATGFFALILILAFSGDISRPGHATIGQCSTCVNEHFAHGHCIG